MPIPAFDTVPDAQVNLNFKMYTDASAGVPLLMSQNAGGHANRISVLAETITAAWANRMVKVDVNEAVAAQKMLSGRESQGIAESLALAQVLTKGAQTTPPVTG